MTNTNTVHLNEIEKTYLSKSQLVIVDFNQLYERLQKSTQKDKDVFWKTYINALKSNTKIRTIELRFDREMYNRDHTEILDMLMSAIQNKRSIKRLCIDMEECSLDRLPELRNLENLDVNSKLNASYLADYCEANQNLVRLTFSSNEIYGKLTDIVPHCKNLEFLTFMVKEHFDDSEYTQFAKLPSLRFLNILGSYESGSLFPLLKALATKESNTLEELIIDAAPMTTEVIFEACRIKSLKKLECTFINVNNFCLIFDNSNGNESLLFCFQRESNATDLSFLSNLTEFTSLRISGRHKAGTLKPFFKAIAENESPKLVELNADKFKDGSMLNYDEISEVFKIKSLKTVQCSYFDRKPMEFPAQLPQISEITIESKISGSLRNLFKGLAQQAPSKLDNLTVGGSPMSLEDLMHIRKIDRLKNLTCGLVDVNTMYHLAQLTQLKVLTITSKHPQNDFSEAVLRFYEASKGKVSIISSRNCIIIQSNKRSLYIEMTPNINSTELVPLASLPNFAYLVISGRHQENSLASLFKAFASSKSTALKLLYIANDISPIEVKEIAQLKTLRYLMCEFSNSQSLQHLKNLPDLDLLSISSLHNYPEIFKGVLSVLMGCPNEITIRLYNRELIFNKNLSRLIIMNTSDGFVSDVYDSNDDVPDGDVYAPLAQLTQLRSLHIIGRHKLGSFENLFKSLALDSYQSLEEINFEKIINYEETLALSQIASLKRLKCGFVDVECVELLIKFKNLQELSITAYPEGFLKPFLQEIAARDVSNLQSLALSGNSLKKEDIAGVARVNSLKRLDCALGDEDNIRLLANLTQLKEITIRADKCDSLVTLLHALFLSESKSIQHLSITDRSISYKEMTIVARIKTLRELCCTLIDKESIKLLDQLPELTKLSIELYQYDAGGIEVLAQLNKLTELAIKSPKCGSLTGLFNELSSRADPILQSLIITGKYIDSTEIDAIAQLKTLTRLQCGFEEDKLYECLSDLTNLEVLDITSELDLVDISQTLLTILQKCHKLKVIEIEGKHKFGDLEFIREALNTVKSVRNPKVQKAFQLRIRPFKYLTAGQIAISDKSYLTICSLD